MARDLGNETITLLVATETIDPIGNATILDYTTQVVVRKCFVEPFLIAEKLQEEITVERDFARSTWRVWAPPKAEVRNLQPHDRVLWDDREYEVFGFEGTWKRFNGQLHHCQFIIQLRAG